MVPKIENGFILGLELKPIQNKRVNFTISMKIGGNSDHESVMCQSLWQKQQPNR